MHASKALQAKQLGAHDLQFLVELSEYVPIGQFYTHLPFDKDNIELHYKQ